jgi:hypothetical protein
MAVAASGPTRRLLVGAWTGIAMMLAGRVVDLRWHAANGRRFERAADQVEAHWLIWLGVLVLLIVAVIGARRVPSRWYVGFRLLLLAVVCHALIDGWTSGSTTTFAIRLCPSAPGDLEGCNAGRGGHDDANHHHQHLDLVHERQGTAPLIPKMPRCRIPHALNP